MQQAVHWWLSTYERLVKSQKFFSSYLTQEDRSGLHRNPDGSIDITLSKEAPADTTNWLPVGEGDFHLFLRIYKPDAAALTDWQPPVVRTN